MADNGEAFLVFDQDPDLEKEDHSDEKPVEDRPEIIEEEKEAEPSTEDSPPSPSSSSSSSSSSPCAPPVPSSSSPIETHIEDVELVPKTGVTVTIRTICSEDFEVFQSEKQFMCRRSLRDFLYIRTLLEKRHPLSVIPPLPQYNRVTAKRLKVSLSLFLTRCLSHKDVSTDNEFLEFLYLSEIDLAKRIDHHFPNGLSGSMSTQVIESLTDQLEKSKRQISMMGPKEALKDDPYHHHFSEIHKKIDEFHSQMRVLKEIVVNYRNRTIESEKDFKREKVVFTNLALNENELSGTLSGRAKVASQMAWITNGKYITDIENFEVEIDSYIHVSQRISKILYSRIDTVLRHYDVSKRMGQLRVEIEKLKKEKEEEKPKEEGGFGFFSAITEKFSEDLETRIAKAQGTLRDLEREQNNREETMNAITETFEGEVGVFNEWKTQDLPQFMKYYAEIKTTYHKQAFSVWNAFKKQMDLPETGETGES